MGKNTINMSEAKRTLNFAIDRNFKLQEEGITPVAVCLEAEAGIGKTSLVEQVAKERNMTYVKLSLHEMEEAGDLIGYPLKEYEVQVAKLTKDEQGNPKVVILPGTQWVNDKQLEVADKNTKYKMTGKNRMTYAKPAWVPEYNENGTIFLMDDYGRCNQTLAQAVMELVWTQKYVSWSLPKKTTIVLTSNPDNGQYNVNTSDIAQRTRYMEYKLDFDIDSWVRWAEEVKLDSRCINFVASYYAELFNQDDQGNSICNPRSFVMFANMIAGIKDWDVSENLDFITMIAHGCFKDDNGRFAQMFSMFIRNKMHLLISPKEMLLGKWENIKEKVFDALYDSDGKWRPDIAALLERRFSNYVLAWLNSDEDTPIAKVRDRIYTFLDSETVEGKKVFNPDQFYHMIKVITSEKKSQTGKLLIDTRIAKIMS